MRRPAVLVSIALTVAQLGCQESNNADPGRNPLGPDASSTGSVARSEPWFEDVTAELGISFRHTDGRSGERLYLETTGAGLGWLSSAMLDPAGSASGVTSSPSQFGLYLVQGNLDPLDRGSARVADGPRNALYWPVAMEGWTDIAASLGLDDRGFGSGLCVGDADGDGLTDLYLTNFGPDVLLLQSGATATGRPQFAPASERGFAIDANPLWGASCAFGDLDGDLDLDLVVTNYLEGWEERPGGRIQCGDSVRGITAYCRPDRFSGQRDLLFINDGGLFEQGQERGFTSGEEDRSLGVVIVDIDGDGDQDVLVTNDAGVNRLYRNQGEGIFREDGLLVGFGLSGAGVRESGMGITVGDVDTDGDLDALVSNYAFEPNRLHLAERAPGGEHQLLDRSEALGLAPPSYSSVGWGLSFGDFDNDGDLDVVTVNGHVMDNIEVFDSSSRYPQPNTLLENRGGRFVDVSDRAGAGFSSQTARVSRGLAVADINSDGLLDLAISNVESGPRVLINRHSSPKHWLGVQLVGSAPNALALGARVEVRHGEHQWRRDIIGGGSFLSQSDLRLHFGLGLADVSEDQPLGIQVTWPDGSMSHRKLTKVDRYIVVFESSH